MIKNTKGKRKQGTQTEPDHESQPNPLTPTPNSEFLVLNS